MRQQSMKVMIFFYYFYKKKRFNEISFYKSHKLRFYLYLHHFTFHISLERYSYVQLFSQCCQSYT